MTVNGVYAVFKCTASVPDLARALSATLTKSGGPLHFPRVSSIAGTSPHTLMPTLELITSASCIYLYSVADSTQPPISDFCLCQVSYR